MPKIAMCQTLPKLGDLDKNLEMIENSIVKAKELDADLILFPELVLTGYHVWEMLEAVSQSEDGVYIEEIKKMCKHYDIHSVISFIEKKESDFFISAMLIDNNGKSLGTYRKTHLFDYEKKYITHGESIDVFKTDLGNIGIMICYDLEFPEVARTLALKGADYILVATANVLPYDHHQFIYAQSRTFENEIPVLVCNQSGIEKETNFFGESIAVNTKGEVTKFDANKEQLKVIEIQTEPVDQKLKYLENRNTEAYQL